MRLSKSLLAALAAACAAALLSSPAVAASVEGLAIRSSVKGEGKTIVFVHGWTCDDSSWEGQVPAFAQDFRVVTLDLPGHGQSDPVATAEAFSMELFAAAVEAVRAEIGADKVVLVGHSMGAGVIRQYALDHPEHVAGLVAVDGELDVRPWANFQRNGPPTRETRAALIESMFSDATPVALRNHIRNMMLGASDVTAEGAGNAIFAQEHRPGVQVSAPALTVWAASRAQNSAFDTAEVFPEWQGVTLPETGHFLMMERPEEFNAILRQFIEQRAQY